MDGTFLNDQSDYDHPRFQRLLTKLQEHNVRFVVASGNQYPHLPQYFTGLTGEITYLAEDGAHIVLDEQTISEDVIPQPLGDFLTVDEDAAAFSTGLDSTFRPTSSLDGNAGHFKAV